MELLRENEKIIIVTSGESEADKTEELLVKLLNLPRAGNDYDADWTRFKNLTQDYEQVPQEAIDMLAEDADQALLDDFKKRHQS